MRRFTIALNQSAAERLAELARAERRDPRDQAALLLERALAHRRQAAAIRPKARASSE